MRNARSLCVRTFLRAPLLNLRAVMEMSSGASSEPRGCRGTVMANVGTGGYCESPARKILAAPNC
jgi:hypothetical protein